MWSKIEIVFINLRIQINNIIVIAYFCIFVGFLLAWSYFYIHHDALFGARILMSFIGSGCLWIYNIFENN